MSEALSVRKKAWERAQEERRGFFTEVARAARVRPQTARRWFLEPDHPDRREIRNPKILTTLCRRFELEPNDFKWLHGEKAARRRARQAVLEPRAVA